MTEQKPATTTASSTSPPVNIVEFNAIAGAIFAQLYEAFPMPAEVLHDRQIAKAAGITSVSEDLPSGRPFPEVFRHTLQWLAQEDDLRAAGSLPHHRVSLTEKGLAALNKIPQGLSATVGTSLVEAASGSDRWKIGDLVGGFIGGFTKSMSGG